MNNRESRPPTEERGQIYFLTSGGTADGPAALDAPTYDLLHLVHGSLIAGEQAALQRLAQQWELVLRNAMLHDSG